MKKKSSTPASDAISRAATHFFIVRGLVRSRLAQGRKLDPYAWLHIEALVYIRDHQTPSMHDLAEHLAITAPSATSLVNALERKGLVKRAADAGDKRSVRLSLTGVGKRHLEETVARGKALLGELFKPLSAAQLREFTRMLGVIIEGCNQNSSK